MRDLLWSWAGYDVRVLATMPRKHQRLYRWSAGLVCLSSFVVGVGLGATAFMVVSELWVGCGVAVCAGLFVLNLSRLHAGGTGFPVQENLEALSRWRPPMGGVVIFGLLGSLLMQPVVVWLMRPFLELSKVGSGGNVGAGLIVMIRGVWQMPFWAGGTTLLLAMLFSAMTWLRFFFLPSVRIYEKVRWQEGRRLVEDAFNRAQGSIGQALVGYPSFSGKLKTHFADPPYNQRPLLFGVDYAEVRTLGLRFVDDLQFQKEASTLGKPQDRGEWYFLSKDE